MQVPEWLRRMPHPTYGNYGGYSKRCVIEGLHVKRAKCPLPVDAMDGLFRQHDHDLREARRIYSPGEKRDRMIAKADHDLAVGLRALPKIRGYKKPIWGPTYRLLAMTIFHPNKKLLN